MRKNWLMTAGGILFALGQIPLGLQYAHLPFPLPLWWNAVQFPIWLAGTIGGAIVGVAGKGQDEHSTVPQVAASSMERVATAAVKDADKPPIISSE